MSNDHMPMWIASGSVYTVYMIMFPRGSTSVYIVTIFVKLIVVVLNSVFTVCNVLTHYTF